METKKKEKNFYKYTTIILLIIILSFGMLIVFNTIVSTQLQQAYNLGQEDAVNLIIQNIDQNGQVNLVTPQSNLTLISVEELGNFQDLLIESIIAEIQTNGEVGLISPDGEEFVITFN